MPVVVFAGQKGGTGKSTLAINVAAELVERGLAVLLVDADGQGSARTWAAVAAELGNPVPDHIAAGADMHRTLPLVVAKYEWIVIDCPPRAGDVQRSAFMVADLVVLPCGPSTLDAWALAETIEQVRAAQAHRPELRAVVVLNRHNPRTRIGAGAREALAGSGVPVAKLEVGQRAAFAEAPAMGLGVTTFAPSSPAAEEIRVLVTGLAKLAQPRRERHGR